MTGPCKDHYIYNTVIRAIIESSFISWMGLLACTIASTYELADYDPLDVVYNSIGTVVGNVSAWAADVLSNDLLMSMIGYDDLPIRLHGPAIHLCQSFQPRCRCDWCLRVPLPQGISQTLIITRVGFSRLRAPSKAAKLTAAVFASNHQPEEKEDYISSETGLVSDVARDGGDPDIEIGTNH
jgi:hypothetical protein